MPRFLIRNNPPRKSSPRPPSGFPGSRPAPAIPRLWIAEGKHESDVRDFIITTHASSYSRGIRIK